MELYLMRHGKALPEALDPDEGLSPVGADRVRLSAGGLSRLGFVPDAVLHSPKKRARETAELVVAALGGHRRLIWETPLLRPMTPASETLAFLGDFAGRASRVLVVGHLPNLPTLAASFLADGASVRMAWDNAAVMRLDVESFNRPIGRLVWFMGPGCFREPVC